MKKAIAFLLFTLLLNADGSYYERGKLVKLQKMHETRVNNRSGIEYYKTRNGQKIGITDEILVQCKSGVDCSSFLAKLNLTNVSNLTEKIFVIKVTDYDRIFSLSRALFESGSVEFAHPNFVKERKLR